MALWQERRRMLLLVEPCWVSWEFYRTSAIYYFWQKIVIVGGRMDICQVWCLELLLSNSGSWAQSISNNIMGHLKTIPEDKIPIHISNSQLEKNFRTCSEILILDKAKEKARDLCDLSPTFERVIKKLLENIC